jgi:hypothetical protein
MDANGARQDREAEGVASGSSKKLRVNSILDGDLRRIRKPCEARAGHGLIVLLIALSIVGTFVALVVLLVKKLFAAS